MTTVTRKYTPKSELTLSAVEGPDEELARSTALIDRELERVDTMRGLGFELEAERALDRLFDSILGPDDYLSFTPSGELRERYLAERDRPIITESELRLMDGNR